MLKKSSFSENDDFFFIPHKSKILNYVKQGCQHPYAWQSALQNFNVLKS